MDTSLLPFWGAVGLTVVIMLASAIFISTVVNDGTSLKGVTRNIVVIVVTLIIGAATFVFSTMLPTVPVP